MSSDPSLDETKPSIVGVATSGIQDVSALLPLLGTDQCERLVTSALQNGLLYAAATPMSIFGSLGIVKAGFVVLWGSIDNRIFPGPTLRRDAGFTPSGIGSLLIPVATDNRRLYVAEDKMRRHMSQIAIQSVEVNLLSWDLWVWNLRLVGMAILLSSLGLLPYIYLIMRLLSDAPFQASWLYPILRILGCDMVAIAIQTIFQIRILEEVYFRLRFLAMDRYLKAKGNSAVPKDWDSNQRSRVVLSLLRHIDPQDHATKFGLLFERSISGRPASFRFEVQGPPSSSTEGHVLEHQDSRPTVREGGGGDRSSGSEDLQRTGRGGRGSTNETATGVLPTVTRATPGDIESGTSHNGPPGKQGGGGAGSPTPYIYHRLVTTIALCLARTFLLFGLIMSVVGYIGCFSLVQASPSNDSKGSGIWLATEAILAFSRTIFWAWNPGWDDPPCPIVLEKIEPRSDQFGSTSRSGAGTSSPSVGKSEEGTSSDKGTEAGQRSSYGIGWMLESLTANDVCALIVGTGEPEGDDAEAAPGGARQIGRYLRDTLLVPGRSIVTRTNGNATREAIIEALTALPRRIERDAAPVIVYFSTDTCVDLDTGEFYFVPHGLDKNSLDGNKLKEVAIPYGAVVDVLRRIAEERTDNITLILDFPDLDREEMGKGSQDTGPRQSVISEDAEGALARLALANHNSHVILAPREPKSKVGWAFTQALIRELSNSDPEHFATMSYKNLVDLINEEGNKKKFRFIWNLLPGRWRPTAPGLPKDTNSGSGNQQSSLKAFSTTLYENRLLFGGLLSRKITDQNSSPVITVKYFDLDVQ